MKKNKTVPTIRFFEFSDAWEQHNVGDFLTVSKIPGHTGVDAKKLTVKLWGKGVVEKTDLYGGSENTQYYIRRAGQFMYGKLDFLHAAFGIVPENLDKFESTLDSPAFDLNGIDAHFLLNRVTQEDFYLKHGLVANGSRKAKRIHEDAFMTMPILVPPLAEQQRIGNYFVSLDRLIALHQNKLEKMQQVRELLLNQLFTGLGRKFPEIRFAGNQEEWKLLSLRNIVTSYTDYLPTPTDGYTRLGIRSHMKGTFYDYVAPSKKLGEKRLQRVKRDNLIVNIVFAWEHAIAVTTEEDEGKLVSHRFPQFSFNEGMYPMFFRYALSDPRFRHHLFLASPSGAGRNKTLRIDEMMDYQLRVPEYEEQKKIAGCLETVDHLIGLYEMELEKIRNVKSACLQGMFV